MSNMLDDARASDILDILSREGNIPRQNLRLDATIGSLGIASMDIIHTIFEIETKFDVEIPVNAVEGDAETMTVGDLVGHVLKIIDGKSDPAAAAV